MFEYSRHETTLIPDGASLMSAASWRSARAIRRLDDVGFRLKAAVSSGTDEGDSGSRLPFALRDPTRPTAAIASRWTLASKAVVFVGT
jgi:hypothetical protein